MIPTPVRSAGQACRRPRGTGCACQRFARRRCLNRPSVTPRELARSLPLEHHRAILAPMADAIDTRDPLISAEGLLEWSRTEPDRLRIVDCRWALGKPGAGRAAYDEAHLPGAIHLDLDDDLADLHGYGAPGRHPLPSPAAFAERMSRAGIG